LSSTFDIFKDEAEAAAALGVIVMI
jgi:hypothetical protein